MEEHAKTVRGAALSGGRWSALESIVAQLLSVGTTAVLARILTPEDFGLVAVVAVINGLVAVLLQVGLGAGLIQRDRVSDLDLSSAVWASLALSSVAAVALALLSGFLATSIGQPGAAPYLAVSALSIPFGLVATIPRAILLRHLRFLLVSVTAIVTFAVYAAVAISLAVLWDAGAWAVVAGRVVSVVAGAMTVFVAARWRPSFAFSWASVRRDLSFNFQYLGSGLFSYAGKNADYWAVARATDSSVLGLYYIAYVLPNVIRQRMTQAAQRALFPVFSRIRADQDRLKHAYVQAIRFVTLAAFPALLGLAATSSLLVPLILGEKWLSAARTVAILATAAAFDAMIPLGVSLFTALGTPGLNMVMAGVRLSVLVPGLLFASRWSQPEPFALAVLAGAVAATVSHLILVNRRIKLSAGQILSAMFPATVATAAMLLMLWPARVLVMSRVGPLAAQAALLVGFGCAVYLSVGVVFSRKAFRTLLEDVKAVIAPGSAERSSV